MGKINSFLNYSELTLIALNDNNKCQIEIITNFNKIKKNKNI